jgi:hypothetical protein
MTPRALLVILIADGTPTNLIIYRLWEAGMERQDIDKLLYDSGVRLPSPRWNDDIPPKRRLELQDLSLT